MRLFIESTELKLLLERKREYIGTNLADSISFCLSVLGSGCSIYQSDNYYTLPNFVLMVICLISGLRGVKMLYKAMSNNYTHKELYADIETLNKIEHAFSLAIIKNTFDEYPNKFLLRYDTRWQCWLLPYFKTVEENDAKNIADSISMALKINKAAVKAKLSTSGVMEKYSESDKIDKTYYHSFYKVTIKNFNNDMQASEFKVDEQMYKWFSLDDMLNNERIMKVNRDVVDTIRGLC